MKKPKWTFWPTQYNVVLVSAVQQSESDRERQISYYIAYMWNQGLFKFFFFFYLFGDKSNLFQNMQGTYFLELFHCLSVLISKQLIFYQAHFLFLSIPCQKQLAKSIMHYDGTVFQIFPLSYRAGTLFTFQVIAGKSFIKCFAAT